MLKRTISLILLILFIGAEGTQAQVTITYSSAGKHYFSMSIPDDWRVNVGSERDLQQLPEDPMLSARLISAMPSSGVPLWFGMWVPEDLDKIEGAKEYIASLGLDLLDDVAIADRKHDTLNGMAVTYVSGTGKKDGEIMDFRAGFFQLSPDRVAIAIYIGPPETTSRHGQELMQMIESLRSLSQ